MRERPILRLVFMVLMVLVLLGLALNVLPLGAWTETLLRTLHRLGPWGPALFVLIYMIACLFCLPITPLSLAAGFLFGLVFGLLTASAGLVVGATVPFLISRWLFRDWFQRRFAEHPKFCLVERAVVRSDFKVVALVRFCPMFPYGVMNYVFGVLPIPLGRYAAASLLGHLPSALVYVYLGSAARDLSELLSGKATTGPAEQAIFVFGLVTLLIVMAVLVRIARVAFRESLAPDRGTGCQPVRTKAD